MQFLSQTTTYIRQLPTCLPGPWDNLERIVGGLQINLLLKQSKLGGQTRLFLALLVGSCKSTGTELPQTPMAPVPALHHTRRRKKFYFHWWESGLSDHESKTIMRVPLGSEKLRWVNLCARGQQKALALMLAAWVPHKTISIVTTSQNISWFAWSLTFGSSFPTIKTWIMSWNETALKLYAPHKKCVGPW